MLLDENINENISTVAWQRRRAHFADIFTMSLVDIWYFMAFISPLLGRHTLLLWVSVYEISLFGINFLHL